MSPHLINLTDRNSSYACKSVFFFGKGPGQGQIPGLLGHGPQIPVLLTTVKQQTYVQNFSSLGAIAAEK
jgi:hypothetical protein